MSMSDDQRYLQHMTPELRPTKVTVDINGVRTATHTYTATCHGCGKEMPDTVRLGENTDPLAELLAALFITCDECYAYEVELGNY
jgi:hypothetical protein